MSKRKCLFDRGDNYRVTGIPCGNPRRVQTGEVLCMPSTGSSSSSSKCDEQPEDVETEGEKHIKAMAQKQLKTNFTINELLAQRRQFTEAGRYKPVTKEIRGMLGLQEYEDVVKGDKRVEILRHYGLTDDEIRLQLAKEGVNGVLDPSVTSRSTFGADPQIEKGRLADIETKMKEKNALLASPDKFRDQKHLSRQRMDLERSLFQGTQRDSSALPHLLTTSRTGTGNDVVGDPANHLPELLAELEERARRTLREKRRRRRKRDKRRGKNDRDDVVEDRGEEADDNRDENDDGEDGGVVGCLTFEEICALKSPGESACTVGGSSSLETSVSVPNAGSGGDQSTKKLSDKSGSRTVLTGLVEFFPVDYVSSNRLSLDEIRKLPKFENYDAGSPNNVLYLKNLSQRLSERDLVSMFGRFQKDGMSEIVYRLMTGRMRGQAFVTFPCTELASQALELVNGFQLHGKPVIVQYGKRDAP